MKGNKIGWIINPNRIMYEKHENEQYFFDEGTLDHLVQFLGEWEAPCCICAPLLGRRVSEVGITVTILDIDDRFCRTKGFQYYDIYRPKWLDQEFDLILCDPPFFNVSLSQLFKTLRLLSHHNFEQYLVVGYLRRRASAITGTFSPFDLQPTGYCPGYQTVQKSERNEIEFFSNLPDEKLKSLISKAKDINTER